MTVSTAAAIITISDGVAAGTRSDDSGDVAEELLASSGFATITRDLVRDDQSGDRGAAARACA